VHNAKPSTKTVDENLEVASGARRLETAQDSGEQRTPGMFRIPALVALLFWAVEESGDEAGWAREVLQTLLVTVQRVRQRRQDYC
jgi:hypothetical protein